MSEHYVALDREILTDIDGPFKSAFISLILLFSFISIRSNSLLRAQPGEQEIDFITQIEDSRGHPGVLGGFKLTNLRLIWFSSANSVQNICFPLFDFLLISPPLLVELSCSCWTRMCSRYSNSSIKLCSQGHRTGFQHHISFTY
jgi:hypothetical protein